MQRIFKYPVLSTDIQTLNLPLGARILSVQAQKDNVFLWALVDDAETRLSSHTIHVVGTGNPPPFGIHKMTHLGTVQLYEGALVFHVFQEPQ